MITSKRLIFVAFLIFIGIYTTQAQDAAVENTNDDLLELEEDEQEAVSPALELSGSVDVYYRANLSAKNNPDVSYPVPGTSFANGNGFSLGMFNLISSYSGERAGIVADLVFGPRGEEAVFGSLPSSNIVNQLYVYWNVSDAVTLTLGNFNTFLGYEVISPVDNFNYSTSYMFSYGPFSHTGVKADFSLSEKWSLMVGVFNPTDLTESNPFSTYTTGAQLGYSGDASSIFLNLLYGDQDGKLDEDFLEDGMSSGGATFQADITAGFDITDDFYLGLNTTYNTTAAGEVVKGTSIEDLDGDPSDFYGLALYAQLATSDAFSLGLRGEFFGEANFGAGAIGAYDDGGDATMVAFTLSGNYSVGNLTIIPELRLDNGSEDFTFVDADLEQSSSLVSFLLAAVYGF